MIKENIEIPKYRHQILVNDKLLFTATSDTIFQEDKLKFWKRCYDQKIPNWLNFSNYQLLLSFIYQLERFNIRSTNYDAFSPDNAKFSYRLIPLDN